ncbi:basic proline-rich protein-like [Homarus americanus]|uniref:basic proline-rich protein-like n=1 Tax=Homarus americanus TaxID=6706 RepID=UPI001C44AB1B|nr:basic proline-rich protein-like [Homarus americanus]
MEIRCRKVGRRLWPPGSQILKSYSEPATCVLTLPARGKLSVRPPENPSPTPGSSRFLSYFLTTSAVECQCNCGAILPGIIVRGSQISSLVFPLEGNIMRSPPPAGYSHQGYLPAPAPGVGSKAHSKQATPPSGHTSSRPHPHQATPPAGHTPNICINVLPRPQQTAPSKNHAPNPQRPHRLRPQKAAPPQATPPSASIPTGLPPPDSSPQATPPTGSTPQATPPKGSTPTGHAPISQYPTGHAPNRQHPTGHAPQHLYQLFASRV